MLSSQLINDIRIYKFYKKIKENLWLLSYVTKYSCKYILKLIKVKKKIKLLKNICYRKKCFFLCVNVYDVLFL